MKQNGIYAKGAVVATFMKYYKMKDLADKIIVVVKKDTDEDLQIAECRDSSIVFKKKRDSVITDAAFAAATAKAMRKIIDKDSDVFSADLNDRYELDFSIDSIDTEFIESVSDITKSPKNFYIEFDI